MRTLPPSVPMRTPSKILRGITTEVTGNGGTGPLAGHPDAAAPYAAGVGGAAPACRKRILRREGMRQGAEGRVKGAAHVGQEDRQEREAMVREHYDEPPEIFASFLDKDLNYSAAFFTRPGMTLDEAQREKVATYAEWLQARPGGVFLDAGCGWGPLCLHLAIAHGARVTGLTLSPNQAAYANRRAQAEGVASRMQALVQPFLEHPLEAASLDGVSFIGSIVHMRERQEVYRRVAEALRPGGRLVVSETYAPSRNDQALQSRPARFVLNETFGFTHVTALSEELGAIEDAGLEVLRVENSTDHYFRTLEAWLPRLRAARTRIEAIRPGAYRGLRTYLELGRTSMRRHATVQYEIVAERRATPSAPAAP